MHETRGIQGWGRVRDGGGGTRRKESTLTTHPSILLTLQSETIPRPSYPAQVHDNRTCRPVRYI